MLIVSYCTAGNANKKQLAWLLSSEIEYNNNLRLDIEDPIAMTSSITELGMDYVSNSDKRQLLSKLYANIERPDLSEYDFEGYDLKLNYTRRHERQSYTYGLDSTRQPTNSTEIDDTGNVENFSAYKLASSATLAYRRDISQKQQALISGSYQVADYETDNQADYHYFALSPSWQRVLTEKSILQAQLNASVYESEFSETFGFITQTVETTSQSSGLSLIYSLNNNEQSDLHFLIGTNRTQTKQNVAFQGIDANEIESDETGYIFNFIYKHRFETASTKISLTRDIQPSGSGSLTEIDELRLDLKKNLSEKDSVSIQLSYKQRKTDEDILSLSSQNRRYNKLSFGYKRKITQNLSGLATIQYREQKLYKEDEIAENLIGKITLRYTPKLKTW